MELFGYKIKRIDEKNIAVGKASISKKTGELILSGVMYFSTILSALKYIRRQVINQKINTSNNIDEMIKNIEKFDESFIKKINKMTDEIDEISVYKYRCEQLENEYSKLKEKLKNKGK